MRRSARSDRARGPRGRGPRGRGPRGRGRGRGPRAAGQRPPLRRIAGVVVALAALMLAGCVSNADDGAGGDQGAQHDVEAHQWALDHGDSSLAATAGRRPTIALQGDSAHGAAPCNTYRAAADLRGGAIRLTAIAATRMSCGDDVDAADSQYLAALAEVRSVAAHDDAQLVLTGPNGLRLSFRAYDAAEEIVRSWHVTGVARGDGVQSALAGTDPVLAFSRGGEVSLAAGCNSIGGTWALDGDRLTIGELRTTLMACDAPPGVMEQESALMSALDDARTAEATPDALLLLDADGLIVLVAEPAP